MPEEPQRGCQVHRMRLHTGPFELIKSGRKGEEVRLNDMKRRLIRVGDRIEFTNRARPEEKVLVEVAALDRYGSFAELFDILKGRYPDSNREEFLSGLRQYYSPEDEERYGVLEIGIRLTGDDR